MLEFHGSLSLNRHTDYITYPLEFALDMSQPITFCFFVILFQRVNGKKCVILSHDSRLPWYVHEFIFEVRTFFKDLVMVDFKRGR